MNLEPLVLAAMVVWTPTHAQAPPAAATRVPQPPANTNSPSSVSSMTTGTPPAAARVPLPPSGAAPALGATTSTSSMPGGTAQAPGVCETEACLRQRIADLEALVKAQREKIAILEAAVKQPAR